MKMLINRLRGLLLLLLVISSALMGLCQQAPAGFSAGAAAINFYINDNPSVYAYSGQTRVVSATVQISIVLDGTYIPGVHTPPTWTVTITRPDPTNPQQTITVATETFTYPGYPYVPLIHPGAYTTTNVSIMLPAAAGAYTYTASLTGGAGTPAPVTDCATIVKVESVSVTNATSFDDGDNDPNTEAYKVAIASAGYVTVTFTPVYAVSEANLPTEWTVTGGTGTGKLSRTVTLTSSNLTSVICTCGSSTKTAKIYVYTASITSMPSLCVGGIDDGVDENNNPILGIHKGNVAVNVSAGNVGMSGVQVTLAFSEALQNTGVSGYLLPSLPSSMTTDSFGNATGIMTSGKAVFPGGIVDSDTAKVVVKVDNTAVLNSGKTLDIQNVSIYLSADENEFSALDWVNLTGMVVFNNINIITHNITWHCKYWAYDSPNIPENWETAYDCEADQEINLTSQPEMDDPISDYGILFNELDMYGDEILFSEDWESYVAVFEGGLAQGWVYWYIEDNDALEIID